MHGDRNSKRTARWVVSSLEGPDGRSCLILAQDTDAALFWLMVAMDDDWLLKDNFCQAMEFLGEPDGSPAAAA